MTTTAREARLARALTQLLAVVRQDAAATPHSARDTVKIPSKDRRMAVRMGTTRIRMKRWSARSIIVV